MSARPAVGIDLGGTKIHVGLVSPDGEILAEERRPTQADTDARTVLDNIADCVRNVWKQRGLSAQDLAGVGLGSPGPMEMDAGRLITPVNLPALHHCPIVAELENRLNCPVALNNDANVFGLGEARFGAGKDAGVCCGLTLGTGLGCFLVMEGKLYNGPHKAGAELWCSPHLGDQIEVRVSGRGIARNYQKVADVRKDARELAKMAAGGDQDALAAYEEFGRDLAVPAAWLCNIIDPDVMVLGGSITHSWDLFKDSFLAEVHKYLNRVTVERVAIRTAELGEQAAVLGAAALVLDAPL